MTRVNFSPTNYAIVKASLKCNCEPYEDVKTYQGWKKEGHQIAKGQKGIRVMTYVDVNDKNEKSEKTENTHTMPWRSYVFCKHQLVS